MSIEALLVLIFVGGSVLRDMYNPVYSSLTSLIVGDRSLPL